MADEKYLTIPELARLLGVSRITIYNRVKKGQIPATKIGRTYVIADRTIANILGSAVTKRGKEKDRCRCAKNSAGIRRGPEEVR